VHLPDSMIRRCLLKWQFTIQSRTSMKFECSKRIRGILRQLTRTAHERELGGLLKPLAVSFDRWRSAKIDTKLLAAEVDEFAKGYARRRLAQKYSDDRIVHMIVAQAIVRGKLTEAEVPADVFAALERALEFYRRGLANGSISFDEEDD
jgi:hypothetical protein